MKKIILFLFCFVPFISFSQTNKDSIEVTILSETNNLYVKSNHFEGVVFVWDENDTLHWTPNIDEIIKIENYIEELFNRNKFRLVYFNEMKYSDLSNHKRQYIANYYSGSKKKYLHITFLAIDTYESNEFNDWLKKPFYITGGEPQCLYLLIDFEKILKEEYEGY